MKRYIEKYGKTFKVEVYYNLGGINYFTGEMERRGYYFSVSPVKVEDHGSFKTESYVAFTGAKWLLLEVKRKSDKALKKAEEMITEEKIAMSIDFVNGRMKEREKREQSENRTGEAGADKENE